MKLWLGDPVEGNTPACAEADFPGEFRKPPTKDTPA